VHQHLWPQIEAQPGLLDVYRRIEMPTAAILGRIERTGVLIDSARLAAQSRQLAERMVAVEREAFELAGQPGITVLMLGGRVRWEALSVVGQLGDGLFDRINVQKAFLGAAGFTVESGLSDATDEEAQIKRSMVSAAREVIAIVDHTKWERAAFATFCSTDQVGMVLTDAAAPVGMVDELRRRSIDVRLVDDSSRPASVNEGNRRGSSRLSR